MRGRHEEQEVMVAHVDMEGRVPKDHPLRIIKAVAYEALKRLSPELDRMYSRVGRASVPQTPRLETTVYAARPAGRRNSHAPRGRCTACRPPIVLSGPTASPAFHLSHTLGDVAYGDGGTRQSFADAGRTLIAKVPPTGQQALPQGGLRDRPGIGGMHLPRRI